MQVFCLSSSGHVPATGIRDQENGACHSLQQNVSFWNPINRNQPLGKWLKTRIARGLPFKGCSTQAGLFHHLSLAFPPDCLL